VAGTASTSTAQNKSIAIRAILLGLLLAAANFWSLRHLGFGLEDPAGLLGLTGFVTAASFWLDYFLDKDAQEELSEPARVAVRTFLLRRVLATPTLAMLYLLAGIGASICSSITVVGAPGGQDVPIDIFALDDADAEALTHSKADAVPRLFLANPFGRPLRISPEGYSSQTKVLFPLTGLTLSLDDFEPLPTLLLRPGAGALFGLLDKDIQSRARYVVLKRSGESCEEIQNTHDNAITAAAMIGVRRPIPSDLPSLWLLELQSADTEGDGAAPSQANHATLMLAWRTPQPLTVKTFLTAGDQIQVQVLRNDNLMGFADYTVTQEPFQDIALTDGSTGLKPCPIKPGSAG
jgi:hypothetical protein